MFGWFVISVASLAFQILILWRGFSAVHIVLLLAVRQCKYQSHQKPGPELCVRLAV